jgi:UDP-N-acetylglucosamine transferase subunit ALG13
MATLLVSSPGGHFRELLMLAERLDVPRPFTWMTPRSPQSEAFLTPENHVPIPYSPSRDLKTLGAIRGVVKSFLDDRSDIDVVVSTGSVPAVPVFLEARRRRIECIYVESAARTMEPSLTGRLVQVIPGVRLFAQYEGWSNHRWRYAGSVWDGFRAAGEDDADAGAVRKVVVTVGVESYSFRRAFERLVEILPVSAEVLWQSGVTDTDGLGIQASRWVQGAKLEEAIGQADVVVSHAGVGSALTALSAGKCPVLLPREARYGEHVDDHQFEVAGLLAERRLAVTRRVDALALEDLAHAAAASVVAVPAGALHLRSAATEAKRWRMTS